MLRAAEHQHALGHGVRLSPARADELRQKLRLLPLRDRAEVLLHGVGRLADARYLDERRVHQHRVDGALDAGRDGGREQQVLPLLGQGLHDAAHTGPKAHVKHAVGLVQHEYPHLR